MSFFDRFKTKEDKSKKKDEPKKEVKVEKKEKEAEWAVSKEEPVQKQAEAPKEEPKAAAEEKPKKKPAKKASAGPKAAEKKKAPAKKSEKVWHITKRTDDGMWQVKAEGNERATKLFKTKAEAEEYVKTLVSNNEGSKAVRHKKTGEFQKK